MPEITDLEFYRFIIDKTSTIRCINCLSFKVDNKCKKCHYWYCRDCIINLELSHEITKCILCS